MGRVFALAAMLTERLNGARSVVLSACVCEDSGVDLSALRIDILSEEPSEIASEDSPHGDAPPAMPVLALQLSVVRQDSVLGQTVAHNNFRHFQTWTPTKGTAQSSRRVLASASWEGQYQSFRRAGLDAGLDTELHLVPIKGATLPETLVGPFTGALLLSGWTIQVADTGMRLEWGLQWA